MIFGVPAILRHCSRHFTLSPVTWSSQGTPSGCGEFMDPPRFLTPGDVGEVEIEGIGTISNPVVSPGGASRKAVA